MIADAYLQIGSKITRPGSCAGAVTVNADGLFGGVTETRGSVGAQLVF